MKANFLSGLMILALCSVSLGAITIRPVELFEKADQPRWQVDAAKGEAVFVPNTGSLETPALILNTAALTDSSLTLTIDSDAKQLRINGQPTFIADLAGARHHEVYLSSKGADSAFICDCRASSRLNGLWQAAVAGQAAKIPLAFVGATYVTIHVQTGTQPPAVLQPAALAPGPIVVVQRAPVVVITPAAPVAQPFVMEGNGTLCPDGSMVLTNGQRLTSTDAFRTPVSFKIVAKTDSTNIRIGFPANELIFNWEVNADQLRIDGGPANGVHVDGAGRVPCNQWVTFDITVNPDVLVFCIDGRERARIHADFSRINQPLSIFQYFRSTVTVKSVQAVAGLNNVPMCATFATPAPRGVSFDQHRRIEAAELAREQQEAADRARLQQIPVRFEPSPAEAGRIRVLQEAIDRFQLSLQQARENRASPAMQAAIQRTIDDLNRQLQAALNQ